MFQIIGENRCDDSFSLKLRIILVILTCFLHREQNDNKRRPPCCSETYSHRSSASRQMPRQKRVSFLVLVGLKLWGAKLGILIDYRRAVRAINSSTPANELLCVDLYKVSRWMRLCLAYGDPFCTEPLAKAAIAASILLCFHRPIPT